MKTPARLTRLVPSAFASVPPPPLPKSQLPPCPLQDVFVCLSVVTHTAIALERYRAIVKSMMKKISVTVTKAVIFVTWFSCYVSAALPIAVISRTE